MRDRIYINYPSIKKDEYSQSGYRMEKLRIPDFQIIYYPWIKEGMFFVCSKDFKDENY